MPDALVYEFDFGTALSFSENVTQKLTSRSKSGGSASNIAPQYYDGAMFTNDYQWLLYGGLLQITDSADPPPANSYVTYEKYDNGGPGRRFDAEDGQIDFATTDGNVTRYIAFGGSASAPSENKGWYFSGMMAKGKGELFAPYGNDTTDPTVFANSLITVDMSQLDEKFTNTTLPSEVTPRISPELVFVPVGQNGILAVIGGVTDSYVLYATPRLNATQLANSVSIAPSSISNIHVRGVLPQYSIIGESRSQEKEHRSCPPFTNYRT